jgi:hypothetical protein
MAKRTVVEEMKTVKLTCGDIELHYNEEEESMSIGNGNDDDMEICNLQDLLDLQAVVNTAVEKNLFNEGEK